jgi:hypothetical protein
LALRAEAYRLACGVGVRWLLLIPALGALIRMVFALGLDRVDAARAQLEGGADGAAVTGFALLSDGLRAGGGILTFVALVLGAASLVRDRENGMLATGMIARGRASLVLGKALALAGFVIAAWALVFAASWGFAALTRGLAGLEIEGVEVVSGAELWADVVDGALAVIPPLVAAAWFALLVSAFADGSGFATAGALVPFVTYDVLKSALPDATRWVFATYSPLLSEGSTLSRLTGLARGYANVDWAPDELLLSAAVPAATGVVLILLAIAVTMRRPA